MAFYSRWYIFLVLGLCIILDLELVQNNERKEFLAHFYQPGPLKGPNSPLKSKSAGFPIRVV